MLGSSLRQALSVLPASGSRARQAAARRLRAGDWPGAIEALRPSILRGLGDEPGERELAEVLTILERHGLEPLTAYADYLGLVAWLEDAGPDAAEVVRQFALFWAGLPHLGLARDACAAAVAARPLLTPEMLRPLLSDPELEPGEEPADARLRIVRGLPARFRGGIDLAELRAGVRELVDSGLIGERVAEELLEALQALPRSTAAGSPRRWSPVEWQVEELIARRRRFST